MLSIAVNLGRRPMNNPQRPRERGQVIVLFAIVLVAILGFSALAIDLGMLRNDRQILVNAMDAGALAGGTKLPVKGAAEQTAANNLIALTVAADYPGITGSQYTISYRCLIGVTTTSPAQANIARDVPIACDPSKSLGRAPLNSDFIGAGATRVAACNPAAGDMCNVVVLSGSTTRQFVFGPVVGVPNGSTGVANSAACSGPCGQPPVGPVDVILIMDRTSSMSGVDTANSLTAANAVRAGYIPSGQWLGLGILGPSAGSGACVVTPAGVIGTALLNVTDMKRWVPLNLTGTGAPVNEDYTLSTSSFAANLKSPCYSNSSTGTDLADPINEAAYALQTYGRAGVAKGIILMTDGQPNAATALVNATSPGNYCLQANNAATAAKNAGIEIFTIGFGLDGSNNIACPDLAGAFKSKTATNLLASMATQPSSDSLGCPGGGSPNSDTDGDHFFCVPKTAGASTNLATVFQAAAAQLVASSAHLIELYPSPVITAVAPTSGLAAGGTTVTISGHYFSGASRVRFGGVNATYTVNSDTSITAIAPAGTVGTTVHITVSTPAGTSYTMAADRFTYN